MQFFFNDSALKNNITYYFDYGKRIEFKKISNTQWKSFDNVAFYFTCKSFFRNETKNTIIDFFQSNLMLHFTCKSFFRNEIKNTIRFFSI